ncbi:hypothetical protein SUGI_0331940 [Cryptomeria japonica]|nr:hypothetical protein SUGI_0331940 [Cryptomeria japonica]
MAASGIHKSQYAYDAEAEKSSKQWATQGMGLRRKPKGKVHAKTQRNVSNKSTEQHRFENRSWVPTDRYNIQLSSAAMPKNIGVP